DCARYRLNTTYILRLLRLGGGLASLPDQIGATLPNTVGVLRGTNEQTQTWTGGNLFGDAARRMRIRGRECGRRAGTGGRLLRRAEHKCRTHKPLRFSLHAIHEPGAGEPLAIDGPVRERPIWG